MNLKAYKGNSFRYNMRRISQIFNNLKGYFLGSGVCPVTGDIYLETEITPVNYSENRGIAISTRAFKEFPVDKIAQGVLERVSQTPILNEERIFTREEIAKNIRASSSFPSIY